MNFIAKFKAFQVPSRYVFKDPDTGREFSGKDMKELFDQIIPYREQNRLPTIDALDHVIENYLCHLPENSGKCEARNLKRGWWQYLKGGISLLENLAYGKENMVEDSIAEERAKICIGCPNNVFPDKGGFLKWSDELAEAATGGRRIPSYDKIGNCSACSCVLKAKTFFKGPFKLTDKEKSKLPDFCWMLKEKIEIKNEKEAKTN